jgi:hypothetical protein
MDPRKPLRVFSPDASASPRSASSRTEKELDQVSGMNPAKTVPITLGQMVPLLMDAAEKNRLWLNDFADETVQIDADLYEVLLAYERLRRRDAA